MTAHNVSYVNKVFGKYAVISTFVALSRTSTYNFFYTLLILRCFHPKTLFISCINFTLLTIYIFIEMTHSFTTSYMRTFQRRGYYENRNSIKSQSYYPTKYINRIIFINRTSLPGAIVSGIFVRCVRLFC